MVVSSRPIRRLPWKWPWSSCSNMPTYRALKRRPRKNLNFYLVVGKRQIWTLLWVVLMINTPLWVSQQNGWQKRICQRRTRSSPFCWSSGGFHGAQAPSAHWQADHLLTPHIGPLRFPLLLAPASPTPRSSKDPPTFSSDFSTLEPPQSSTGTNWGGSD